MNALKLSIKFVELLRAELTVHEWNQMTTRNMREQNPQVCHSHDFCDANMVMLDAWKACGGKESQIGARSDKWIGLWNEAWELAKPVLGRKVAK